MVQQPFQRDKTVIQIFGDHISLSLIRVQAKHALKYQRNYHKNRYLIPFFEKNTLPFEWHTYVDLDLDEIGIDKVIVLSIGCLSYLNLANPPGMVIITQIEGERETILFRNPVYVDDYKTKEIIYIVYLRIF